MWVLLIIIVGSNGPAIQSVEFKTEKACANAHNDIMSKTVDGRSNLYFGMHEGRPRDNNSSWLESWCYKKDL